jgi:hypothetical protein
MRKAATSKSDPWAWLGPDQRRARYEPDPEFIDTPYLTALVQVATVIGTFIGVFTAIILAYQWHNGFADYWSLILILVLDVAVNVGARVVRRRRRSARGYAATGQIRSDEHARVDRSTEARRS